MEESLDELVYLVPAEWHKAWLAWRADRADPLSGPPGLDQAGLLVPEDQDIYQDLLAGWETRRLRPGLDYPADYAWVSAECWAELGTAATPIRRRVLEGAPELSPLFIWAVKLDKIPGSDQVQEIDEALLMVSRRTEVGQLLQALALHFNESPGGSRIRLLGEAGEPPLAGEELLERPLGEIGLEPVKVTLEAMDRHGRWPDQVTKLLVGNTSALSGLEPHSARQHDRHSPSGQAAGPGLCGLYNLVRWPGGCLSVRQGNTCYMNSVLQCLSNTAELTQSMLDQSHAPAINRTNPLGTGGKLVEAYAQLSCQLWNGGHGAISPGDLKQQLGLRSKQFEGSHQHDAQELLGCLLDGMHEDLCSWDTKGNSHSMVSALFRGQLVSKLSCPACQSNFDKADPSMLLSLPLPNSFAQTFELTVLPWPGGTLSLPALLGVRLAPWSAVPELIDQMRRMLDRPPAAELWKVCVASEHRITRVLVRADGLDSCASARLYAVCLVEGQDACQFSCAAQAEPDRPAEPPQSPPAAQPAADELEPGDEEPKEPEQAGLWSRFVEKAQSAQQPNDEEVEASALQLAEAMCVSVDTARQAIKQCNGSVDSAVMLLLEGNMQPPVESTPRGQSPADPEQLAALEPVEVDLPPVIALPGPSGPAAEEPGWPAAEGGTRERSQSEQLMEFVGCSQAQARKALDSNRGNEEQAVMQLLSGEVPDSPPEDQPAVGGMPDAALQATAPEQASGYASDDSVTAQSGMEMTGADWQDLADMFGGDDGPAGEAVEMMPAGQADKGIGFWKSVENGEPSMLKLAIEQGQFEQAQDGQGPINLMLGNCYLKARDRHLQCVEQLLAAKADPNSKREATGQTGLHQAAGLAKPELLALLSSAGCLLDTQDKAGETALHLAAKEGHADAVQQLLALKASVELKDNHGDSCIELAQRRGHDPVLDLLLGRPLVFRLAHYVASKTQPEPAAEPAGEPAGEPAASVDEEANLAAVELKAEGNQHYKAGRFPQAIESYTAALDRLAGAKQSGLAASCLSNRAQCFAQQKEWEQVVHDATGSLEHQPGNVKVLLRRANGLEQLEKHKPAYVDCMIASKLKPPAGLDEPQYEAFLFQRTEAFKKAKQLRKKLVADGIDPGTIQIGQSPDLAVVSKLPRRIDKLPPAVAEPGLVSVPRDQPVCGLELYARVRAAIAWQTLPAGSGFGLRIATRGSGERVQVLEDDQPVELPAAKSGWLEAVWPSKEESPLLEEPAVHSSVAEGKALDQRSLTLEECIDEFVKPERLSGEDAFFCPTCNAAQSVDKRIGFGDLPPVLIVHLKRFYQTTSRRGKISSVIEFPLSGLRLPGTDGSYSLYGVINHSGSLSGGHYTAYARPSNTIHTTAILAAAAEDEVPAAEDEAPAAEEETQAGAEWRGGGEHCEAPAAEEEAPAAEDESGAEHESTSRSGEDGWYHFNDSTVSKVAPEKVVSAGAYVLFYVRDPPESG